MKSKIINTFTLLYFIAILLVAEKIIEYSQWMIQLIKKWEIPAEPFFSKITLIEGEAQHSVTIYLLFAITYIVFYLFIFIGLAQLNRTVELLAKKEVFLEEISLDFRKAGQFFLVFLIGTFITDFVLLLISSTSRPILDLFATETVVFVILAYFLLFLSEILQQGIVLKEENQLTI